MHSLPAYPPAGGYRACQSLFYPQLLFVLSLIENFFYKKSGKVRSSRHYGGCGVFKYFGHTH